MGHKFPVPDYRAPPNLRNFPKLKIEKSTLQKGSHSPKARKPMCRWSTIRSVVKRSGKMSVHERIDIEFQRTKQVTDTERSDRKALLYVGGGQAHGGE